MRTPTRLAMSAAIVLAAHGAALAQGQDLEAKLEKKLASPFLENAAWHTDYASARAAAKESGKLIFGYFTRSYAP